MSSLNSKAHIVLFLFLFFRKAFCAHESVAHIDYIARAQTVFIEHALGTVALDEHFFAAFVIEVFSRFYVYAVLLDYSVTSFLSCFADARFADFYYACVAVTRAVEFAVAGSTFQTFHDITSANSIYNFPVLMQNTNNASVLKAISLQLVRGSCKLFARMLSYIQYKNEKAGHI